MLIELKKGAQTIAVNSSFFGQITRGGHNRADAGHKCSHGEHNELYVDHNQIDGRCHSKKRLEPEGK